MAYNSGFPATYQPIYYPQQYGYQPQPAQAQYMQQAPQMQQANQSQQTPNNNLIWVQGEAGAKSHLVAPNTTVALWDSEAQRIFLKSADSAGMPSMKILNYTIEEVPNIGAPVQRVVNPSVPVSGGVDGLMDKEMGEALKRQIEAFRGDLDGIRSEMETFKADLYGIAGKKATTRKKEGVNDD